MATVQHLKDGRKRVRFSDHNKKERAFHLGRIADSKAESAANIVQRLVNSRATGETPRQSDVIWVQRQQGRIHDYLATLGLVPAREETAESVAPTLTDWLDRYIATRDAHASTKKVWKRAARHAKEYFGNRRRIDTITAGMAIRWFEHMKASGLAESTARKMAAVLRHSFKRALKEEHIRANPFADEEIPVTVRVREKPYVELARVEQVLSVLPSAEWRAIVVLARVAGLRVQSEAPLLRWSDIEWDSGWFVVTSTKTKSKRRVPLFPDVKQAFEDLLRITGDSEFVLGALRERSANWRTPLQKMMKRSGIEPWPALWNSLRGSAATDIVREFGAAAEAEWVGHSRQVSLDHYQTATAEDHQRAIGQTGRLSGKAREGEENAGNSADQNLVNEAIKQDDFDVFNSEFVTELIEGDLLICGRSTGPDRTRTCDLSDVNRTL